VDEVERLAHPGVGNGLVDDLPNLNRRHPVGKGRAEYYPVLAQRLAADERGELHHQPGPGIKAGMPERLVEGEVVEDLDQLRSVTLRVETWPGNSSS